MPARTTRLGSALAAMLLGLSAAAPAATQPPTVVHVDLMDPSTGPEVKAMGIKAEPRSVKAGPVVFDVSNDSKTSGSRDDCRRGCKAELAVAL